MSDTPVLDPRDAAAVLRELLDRVPAYLPAWTPTDGDPGWALAQAVSRYAEAIVQRLNQAPDKNKLAFLDLMGIELLPAQEARAPVVFQALPGIGDGRVPVRTRVGATVEGRDEPLVFETEEAIGLASARLAEVVTVWPARDACADHTGDVVGGRPFTLFEPLQAIPHVLYLAHDTLFSFSGGRTRLEIEVTLATPAPAPLACAWEYWDGQGWRRFVDFDPGQPDASHDGTGGFTRSGVVRLSAACGAMLATAVNGVSARWLRARVADPLPPSPGAVLPEVDRIRLRTHILRPLVEVAAPGGTACAGGLAPDQAFAGPAKLDLTTTFFPFGRAPAPDVPFYFSFEEALAKAGAEVTLCFRRVKTAEEEADEMEAALLEKEATTKAVAAAQEAADVAVLAAQAVNVVAASLGETIDVPARQQELSAARDALEQTGDVAGLATLAGALAAAMAQGFADLEPALDQLDDSAHESQLLAMMVDAVKADIAAAQAAAGLLDTLATLGGLTASAGSARVVACARRGAGMVLAGAQTLRAIADDEDADSDQTAAMRERVQELQAARDGLDDVVEIAEVATLATTLANLLEDELDRLEDEFGDFATDEADQLRGFVKHAVAAAQGAADQVASTLPLLAELLDLEGAGTVDATAPALSAPQLAWEYWNGSAWGTLIAPGTDPAANLAASGEVSFVVPDDLEPTKVNDVEARWVRVRLASGAFARVRMVRWSDSATGKSNVMPILEPRPPALADPWLGYTWHSPTRAPEHCVTHNDFRFEDHTAHARWAGPAFAPFRPSSDLTPTLYLGFDRRLPADHVGLYVDVVEDEGHTEGAPLAWEWWDGARWQALEVDDETSGLALPGIVSMVWPGAAGAPPDAVVFASGTSLRLLDRRAATRFRPGDVVSVQQDGAGELGVVAGAADGGLTLEAPLGRDYAQATVELATQPRFGQQRTWLRARLQADGAPPSARLRGIHLNAVWAAQLETVENETLGSSDGQPSQAFFVRHTPVLAAETLEVRELQGPRAEVELPLLKDELLRRGLAAEDLRTVTNRRTGRVDEVWVRWHARPHLLFSGPEDRDAALERAGGRLLFGDGRFGKVPPAGADGVRMLRYRSGGGLVGNVPEGALSQILSGVPVERVANPRAAEGGADGEAVADVLGRGPLVLRHRGQALSAADYEAMAREASPGVAVARALPTTDGEGRPVPGWVRLLVVPHAQVQDARPRPSFELRRRVHDFIAARAPATLSGLSVAGPEYLAVGAEVVVAPQVAGEAGAVRERVLEALAEFLHPLRGGPEGRGWPFGRDVHLSDVAALLEGLPGVDSVHTLHLLRDGTPDGTVVRVPSDRIVVAGALQVTLTTAEA